MGLQQIQIDGKNGVYFSFLQKQRLTFFEVIGQMTGSIDESTTLEDLQVNNKVRLLGFAVMPEITDNPYIGGFEEIKPVHPIAPQPPDVPGDAGFILNVLPCASEKATVSILNEGLTRKKPGTVEFQLLLFSLTYVKEYSDKGLLAKCDYDLIGEDGKMYVSMRQKQGAIAGGDCQNNHPRFEDNVPGLTKYDCKVFLPKQDYLLKMWNIGQVPIKAWVHQPNTYEGENRDLLVLKLENGEKLEYIIDKREFNGEDHRNTVKINGNCVYDM